MSTFSPIREPRAPPVLAPARRQQQQQSATWQPATIPPADVRAIGSCASPGFQARAHRPTIHRAGRPHHGASRSTSRPSASGFFPPNGHQAGASRFLLWLWWVAGFGEEKQSTGKSPLPLKMPLWSFLHIYFSELAQRGSPLVPLWK